MLAAAAGAVLVLASLAGGAALTHLVERRLVARGGAAGDEPGPAGPLAFRQTVRVPNADRWLYPAGPVVALLGVAWALVVIPWGPGWVAGDLGIGVFYFIVVVDFVVLGLSLGGWGADTRRSLDVYYRATAQLVAYVVPLGLALIGPLMMAESLSTVAVVEAQAATAWYVLYQPLGFALYAVCALMQVYRPPFAEPFAPALDGGVHAVYGGWKAALWRVSLAGVLFAVAAMGAVLFLGGWRGPWLPESWGGPLWMAAKTLGLAALLVAAGRRFRPRSTAAMLRLAWRVLIPVGLLNVLIVGGLILAGVGTVR